MNEPLRPVRRDGDDYSWKWHLGIVSGLLVVLALAWLLLQPIIQAR
jgi:hypothetical protein